MVFEEDFQREDEGALQGTVKGRLQIYPSPC